MISCSTPYVLTPGLLGWCAKSACRSSNLFQLRVRIVGVQESLPPCPLFRTSLGNPADLSAIPVFKHCVLLLDRRRGLLLRLSPASCLYRQLGIFDNAEAKKVLRPKPGRLCQETGNRALYVADGLQPRLAVREHRLGEQRVKLGIVVDECFDAHPDFPEPRQVREP